MTVQDFAFRLLPLLVTEYVNRQIEFHGLVDVDTWQKVFPQKETDFFGMNKIQFKAIPIRAKTLMLLYILPNPQVQGEVKFVALIINRETRSVKFMTLARPRFYDEAYEIYELPIDTTLSSHNLEEHVEENYRFVQKLSTHPTSRNFSEEVIRQYCMSNRINISALLKTVYNSFFGIQ